MCLLFSFANPTHEMQITKRLRAAGLHVSASQEIFPEFREYERTVTTIANAYLLPVMSRYLGEIDRLASGYAKSHPAKGSARVRVMQSNGGIISATTAAREPVHTILSGPAGGVLGAQYVAELAGFPRIIAFDMGGTSTDVALIDGALRTTNESEVAGLPVAVPMLDIHTVGAGGGSLARFDRGGALRVGPESAGADPGPICYGRGTKPTVTDAHLILGRIVPEGFLGGDFRLDLERASRMDGARARNDENDGAICAGNSRRGRDEYGESHSRDFHRARPRPARLHVGRIRRRGRLARLRTCSGARNASRAHSRNSREDFPHWGFCART